MSKSQIIKAKFLCKNGSQISPNGRLGISRQQIQWQDRFIEGKWYDGEYETWGFQSGYELNGGWRRYWVVNEMGEKEHIPKAHMKAIFEFDIQKLRDNKIEQIIDNEILNDKN